MYANLRADNPNGFMFSHISQADAHYRMNFTGYTCHDFNANNFSRPITPVRPFTGIGAYSIFTQTPCKPGQPAGLFHWGMAARLNRN